jgi:hypothetical protein
MKIGFKAQARPNDWSQEPGAGVVDEIREHPTPNIQHRTSIERDWAKGWRLEVGGRALDVAHSGFHRPRARRQGYFLIEALVYIALIGAVLAVGYSAMYRCLDSSIALRRNADDMTSALHAGERWRADVRAATAAPRAERTEAGELLRLDGPRGTVTYRFADHAVSRQAGGGVWVRVLPRVQASAMIADPRESVAAWRWELELQPRVTASVKPGRLRPLFTFIAVPNQPMPK